MTATSPFRRSRAPPPSARPSSGRSGCSPASSPPGGPPVPHRAGRGRRGDPGTHEGGRWDQRGVDGSECDWENAVAWGPPHRLVFTWQINGSWQFDPEPQHASEIEVLFPAEGPRQTTVEVEHRHFERLVGGQNVYEAIRGGGGWPLLLQGYAKTVAMRSEQERLGAERSANSPPGAPIDPGDHPHGRRARSRRGWNPAQARVGNTACAPALCPGGRVGLPRVRRERVAASRGLPADLRGAGCGLSLCPRLSCGHVANIAMWLTDCCGNSTPAVALFRSLADPARLAIVSRLVLSGQVCGGRSDPDARAGAVDGVQALGVPAGLPVGGLPHGGPREPHHALTRPELIDLLRSAELLLAETGQRGRPAARSTARPG